MWVSFDLRLRFPHTFCVLFARLRKGNDGTTAHGVFKEEIT